MKKLLDEYNDLKPAKVGEIVEGEVIGKGRSALFLDLGKIGVGKIYGMEFKRCKEELKDLSEGDKVFSKIISVDGEEDFIELSVSEATKEITFDRLKGNKEEGETITIKVLGANKGGLVTNISGIPAFLPVSQLSSENYPKVEGGDKSKILRRLQEFVGEEMEVKVLDLFPKKNQIILSEKAKNMDKVKEMLEEYEVGDVVEGEITGITEFGAFIRFPLDEEKEGYRKLEGLIHISELDWQIIEDPANIVDIGEKVKAQIVDISDGKVSLSLKALKEDPWKGAEMKYQKGDIVEGEVTKINPFGAFIQVEDKIQALCHVSEFEDKRMEEVLEVGKKYPFEVLSVSEEEHKMSLRPIEV
ncbi:MAG: S1 RNA-binding domain-containing protein [Candidatus Nealsonbacteria bacterium]|nr:S1 RNA-binding domain-containing protein [Candidatus Nealsonbacteria bacterium]